MFFLILILLVINPAATLVY